MCGNDDYPLQWLDFLIGNSCKIHDRCFDLAEKTQLQCDVQFGISVFGDFFAIAIVTGMIAFLIVHNYGKDYYNKK